MFAHIVRRYGLQIASLWLVLSGLTFGAMTPQTTHAAPREDRHVVRMVKQDPFGDPTNRQDALTWVKSLKFWVYLALLFGAVSWVVAFSTQIWLPVWYNQHRGFLYGFVVVYLLVGFIFTRLLKEAEASVNVGAALSHVAALIIR